MLKEIFPECKPAIAMVQLRPLPGSYRHTGESLQSIVDSALAEVETLVEAGFDGLQLQNMGDSPSNRKVGPETVANMTLAALSIRQSFPRVPLSILVNWDAEASIAVAEACRAEFVRIEHTFTGASVTSWGISEACCHEATRFHKSVGARTKIFADVFEPHATPLVHRPVDQAVRDTVVEGGADGVFITGRDFDESMDMIKIARRTVPGTPLFLGGGVTAENVAEALSVADGVIVATWIKNGDMRRPVDGIRARTLVESVRQARILGSN